MPEAGEGERDPLIEQRCTGCPAQDFEEKLPKLSEEERAAAARFFLDTLTEARKLLKENPDLWRKRNKMVQQLEDAGIDLEQKFGDMAPEEVALNAINCAVMQQNGQCRKVNPRQVAKA